MLAVVLDGCRPGGRRTRRARSKRWVASARQDASQGRLRHAAALRTHRDRRPQESRDDSRNGTPGRPCSSIMAGKSDLPTEVLEGTSRRKKRRWSSRRRERTPRTSWPARSAYSSSCPRSGQRKRGSSTNRTPGDQSRISLADHFVFATASSRFIGPPGQTALSQYVESLKEGMRVFVPKKELAFYRQPQ